MDPYLYNFLNVTHDIASIVAVVLSVLLIAAILMYFTIMDDMEEEIDKKVKRIFYLGLIIFAISIFYTIFVPDGYTYEKMYDYYNVKSEQRK